MAATELVFPTTQLGALTVRYEKVTAITVEDVVETRTKALLFSMRLEYQRLSLASGNNNLGDISYFTGTL